MCDLGHHDHSDHFGFLVDTPAIDIIVDSRLWASEPGADQIVRTHLDGAMSGLRPKERGVAARAFRYLVTPSNTKIAYTVADLAEYADVRQGQLDPVLRGRCGRPGISWPDSTGCRAATCRVDCRAFA